MAKKNPTNKKTSGVKSSTQSTKPSVAKPAKATTKRQAPVEKPTTSKKARIPPVQETPSTLHIPADLKLDLLQFLNRNEIEKCQLLQRSWNFTVVDRGAQLPLHFLKSLRHVPKAFKTFRHAYTQSFARQTRQLFLESKTTDKKILANNRDSAIWVKNSVIDEVIGFADSQFRERMRTLTGFMGQKISAETLVLIFGNYESGIDEQDLWRSLTYASQFEALSTITNDYVAANSVVIKTRTYHNFAHYLDFMHRQNPTSPSVLKFPKAPQMLEIYTQDFNDFYSTEFFQGDSPKFAKIFETEGIDLTTVKMSFHIEYLSRAFPARAISVTIDRYMNNDDLKMLPSIIELHVMPTTLVWDLWRLVQQLPNFVQLFCQSCGELHPRPQSVTGGLHYSGCDNDVIFEGERIDDWKIRLVMSTVEKTFNLLVIRKDRDG